MPCPFSFPTLIATKSSLWVCALAPEDNQAQRQKSLKEVPHSLHIEKSPELLWPLDRRPFFTQGRAPKAIYVSRGREENISYVHCIFEHCFLGVCWFAYCVCMHYLKIKKSPAMWIYGDNSVKPCMNIAYTCTFSTVLRTIYAYAINN